MNKTRRYLKLTALFTILFILLLLAGNVLFILKHTAAAIACFLAAFFCVWPGRWLRWPSSCAKSS